MLVEAKVESGLGSYDGGKGGQIETQELIAKLMNNLIPDYQNVTIRNCMFGVKTNKETGWPNYSWDQLVACLVPDELDEFTVNSMKRLTLDQV